MIVCQMISELSNGSRFQSDLFKITFVYLFCSVCVPTSARACDSKSTTCMD